MTPARIKNPPLLAILLAGAALRLFRLGAGSLWYDETVSTFLAGSPAAELIRHTAGDIHPPGYYLLLRGWLLLSGYPAGHADPGGQGLEWASAFFSFAFGVLLIPLVYVLACRLSGRRPFVGLIAAALVAISPYNLRYSQEVRMYTLGATLGVLAIYALWRATERTADRKPLWWAVYALAAAAGLYTLYYFVFLLVPVTLWALGRLLIERAVNRRRGRGGIVNVAAWLAANAAVALPYAPWLPIAWRQATQPPVPPWRTAVAAGSALRETWIALTAGQAAPGWLWPGLLVFVPLYALGMFALSWRLESSSPISNLRSPIPLRGTFSNLPAATLLLAASAGSLVLVLLASAITPLYHIRYMFTYSPAFYVIVAAGLVWLWRRLRPLALALGAAWLLAYAAGAYDFWANPLNQPDDHRAAVAYLENHWRPGDLLVVNAGYAYTAVATYWQGPIDYRGRLTGADLPGPRADAGLVMLTTGHVDGGPTLGWGDPASDFYGMPGAEALANLDELFRRFNRVWHYRIYDTVNDPQGVLRQAFERDGGLCNDQVYPGEAYLRVQAYAPRAGAEAGSFSYRLSAPGLMAAISGNLPREVRSGDTIYPAVQWTALQPLTRTLATSLRLVGPDGAVWAQPPDEQPLGPLCTSTTWPPSMRLNQVMALTIPEGTPPRDYEVQLLPYDASNGRPWGPWGGSLAQDNAPALPNGIYLGPLHIDPPDPPSPLRPALARFGPVAVISATTPATALSPGDAIPVDLLWQAVTAPGGNLVVVLQLLDAGGRVAAGLEEQPLGQQDPYPTRAWRERELVRDRHTLAVPENLAPGEYHLILGLYQAEGRVRLRTRSGLFEESDHFEIKKITVK